MMPFLRRFIRNHFCSPARRRLLDAFEANPSVDACVVLVQSSLLAGVIDTIEWQRAANATRICRRSSDLRKKVESPPQWRDQSADLFDQLIALLQHAVQEGIGDYNGRVKDGVWYCLAWGTRGDIRELSFRNPQRSLPHKQLIESLVVRA